MTDYNTPLTAGERQRFYDQEIAPALQELAARCVANGLSFFSVVEWKPGEHGRTTYLSPPSGRAVRWADAAARANGNADALIMALMKEAQQVGHNSAALTALGVPCKPKHILEI